MISISHNSLGTYFGRDTDLIGPDLMIVVMVCGHIINREKHGFPTCKDCEKGNETQVKS